MELVAHVILVSAFGAHFFSFCWTLILLTVLLGQGLGLGPGLDNRHASPFGIPSKTRRSILGSDCMMTGN